MISLVLLYCLQSQILMEKHPESTEISHECALILQKITQNNVYLNLIKQSSEIYQIKNLSLQNLTPLRFIEQYAKYIVKARKEVAQNSGLKRVATWRMNECRLFTWILICYAHLQQKHIQNMTDQDYNFLYYLFPNKQKKFLIYYIRSLLRLQQEDWQDAQKELLKTILAQNNQNPKWTIISYQLFDLSGQKYYRTSSKCRQMWNNHLDKKVNKKSWTREDDLLLFSEVADEGTKWAYISRLFKGSRTDHMIKNRYHSVIQKYRKRGYNGPQRKIILNIIDDLKGPGSITENVEERIVQEIQQEKPIKVQQKDIKYKVLVQRQSTESLCELQQLELPLLDTTQDFFTKKIVSKQTECQTVVKLLDMDEIIQKRKYEQIDQWFNSGTCGPLLF